MEFIAEDPLYVAVSGEEPAIYDTKGHLIHKAHRHVYAQFKRGIASGYAREAGLKLFEFRKKPDDMAAAQWLAYYDSEQDQMVMGWSDDERAAIEQKLLGHDGVVLVEKPRLEPPYRLYDKHRKVAGRRTVDHAITDITAAYESAGFDVEHAVAYEQENGNNPAVIEALRGLSANAEGEVEDDPLIAA